MKRCRTTLLLLLALTATAARAHDTDQFSVPAGQEMADLGPMLSARYAGVVRRAVDRLNGRIQWAMENQDRHYRSTTRTGGNRPSSRRVIREESPEQVLAQSYSPEGVAQAVWEEFGPAVEIIEGLERELYSDKVKAMFPGQLPAYKAKSNFDSIYNKAYSPIDPRNISAIFHASTIKVFGVYLGCDKIGHFTDMGFHYFRDYRSQVKNGSSSEEAMHTAVRLGTEGLFSERGLLGYLTAGSFSNADLVSNYAGCLMYRNLTEPVVLKGRLHEPILVRDGDFWKINDGFDDNTWFERFISDHWNEALNPSLYEPLMRGTVRKLVAERNATLLEFYKDKYGDNDPAEYFSRLAATLSTYYGDDYGHNGEPEHLIHIGNTMPEREHVAHAEEK